MRSGEGGRRGGYVRCLLALLFYLAGMAAFGRIGDSRQVQIFFTGDRPDQARAKAIVENCTGEKDAREVCLIWDGGLAYASGKASSGRVPLQVVGILGEGRLYHWQAAGLPQGDAEGCILSSGACRELFGSREALGNELVVMGKEYVVRGSMDWETPVILIRPRDQETLYTRACVRKKELETKKGAAEVFLAGSGLEGILVEEDWLLLEAMAAMCLFPLALFLELRRGAGMLARSGRIRERILLLFQLLVFCGAVLWLYSHLWFPQDWIPGRWSDFSFWQEKWRDTLEGIRWYVLLPKTAKQAEDLFLAVRTVVCGLLAAVLSPRRNPLDEGKGKHLY